MRGRNLGVTDRQNRVDGDVHGSATVPAHEHSLDRRHGADRRRRAVGRSAGISVLEPPVDLQHNVAPPNEAIAAFRRKWRIAPDSHLIVCVTRLAKELKAEGILSAISALSGPLRALPIQLMIVGDGPARHQIQGAAEDLNARSGEERIVLTGEMPDPRVAYASADISLGMGGSALRALAFSKPLIVQGERGFFELLTPRSLPTFEWQGWYGVGVEASRGAERFAAAVHEAWDINTRRELAIFGRGDQSNEGSPWKPPQGSNLTSTKLLSRVRHESRPLQQRRPVSGARFGSYYISRKTRRLRGIDKTSDDFNAKSRCRHRAKPIDRHRSQRLLNHLWSTSQEPPGMP